MENKVEPQNKVVVVTGASTGIGYNIAQNLVERGYTVYGSVRKKKDAERVSNELGSSFKPLLFDVTDYPAIEKAADQVAKEIAGRGVTALVNNAGIAIGGPMLHLSMEEIKQVFEINVFGLIKMTQAFAPLLGAVEDPGFQPGKIINMSSVSGKIGFPFVGPYVGSKHAVEGISSSWRRELMKYGIDVIVIGPGSVKTPIWNKNEEVDRWIGTPYEPHMKVFGEELIRPIVERALDVDEIGKLTLKIIEANNPKTRYTILNMKFRNWTLPRLLPERMVDKAVAKRLKMI